MDNICYGPDLYYGIENFKTNLFFGYQSWRIEMKKFMLCLGIAVAAMLIQVQAASAFHHCRPCCNYKMVEKTIMVDVCVPKMVEKKGFCTVLKPVMEKKTIDVQVCTGSWVKKDVQGCCRVGKHCHKCFVPCVCTCFEWVPKISTVKQDVCTWTCKEFKEEFKYNECVWEVKKVPQKIFECVPVEVKPIPCPVVPSCFKKHCHRRCCCVPACAPVAAPACASCAAAPAAMPAAPAAAVKAPAAKAMAKPAVPSKK